MRRLSFWAHYKYFIIESYRIVPNLHIYPTSSPPHPPRNTRSSSLVTLTRPLTSSSLRITDRSFQFKMLHHVSATNFLRHCINIISPPTLSLSTSIISTLPSPLSSSITPSLFHSRLKPIFSTTHSNHRLISLSSGMTQQFSGCFWYFWDFF